MTGAQSKSERLNAILVNFRSSIPELRGALIATGDGLPIAQSFGDNTDANRVAAMAATALGLGKRINDTLGAGELSELSVSGMQGQVFIYSVGAKGALAVVTPAGVNLGLLHMEARDTAKAIAYIL